MAKTPFRPTAEQAKAAFQSSMLYEIVFTFGVPAYDPMDYSQWEVINFTRMAHARLLYDFLEKTKEERHKKDVLAVDYGYPAQTIALPIEDRDKLNHDLLHFSYERLRHTAASKPWPNSILSNLLDPVLGFMRYIRDEKPDLFGTMAERDRWCYLIRLLESGRELRIGVVTQLDRSLRYGFDLGLLLPDGKPVLTPTTPSSLMMTEAVPDLDTTSG